MPSPRRTCSIHRCIQPEAERSNIFKKLVSPVIAPLAVIGGKLISPVIALRGGQSALFVKMAAALEVQRPSRDGPDPIIDFGIHAVPRAPDAR